MVDLKEAYGFGVPELARLSGRVACSACGLSKRYIINQVAVEEGFRVVATGHNLDDEAAVLFGNLLNPQEETLPARGPSCRKSPASPPGSSPSTALARGRSSPTPSLGGSATSTRSARTPRGRKASSTRRP